MNSKISILVFRFIVRRLLIVFSAPGWVYGRVACLGKDSFKEAGFSYNLVNVQKARVDGLGSSALLSMLNLKSILREDIKWLLLEQVFMYRFLVTRPKFIIIDSYSELTDQIFINVKNHSTFFANYSDVNRDVLSNGMLSCEGLLNLEFLEVNYRSYFSRLREKYGEIPIIYVHFPTMREQRTSFVKRAEVIVKIVDDIKYEYGLSVIKIPDEYAQLPTNDEFPYHYANEVYTWVAKEINCIYDEYKNKNH